MVTGHDCLEVKFGIYLSMLRKVIVYHLDHVLFTKLYILHIMLYVGTKASTVFFSADESRMFQL